MSKGKTILKLREVESSIRENEVSYQSPQTFMPHGGNSRLMGILLESSSISESVFSVNDAQMWLLNLYFIFYMTSHYEWFIHYSGNPT